ncbi:hypothetical protein FNO01nite_34800 [Flavobacterium noncentrifugens]|uniref:Uncharacterized protein n=1 Tax=Flavobacterium noncentrifugens TaxID=1128970 RepID=A0A1G9DFI7_9FLAO|nr:hypothetical protein [Flavobacterium noncentrifugens]GEP52808.1 hypothetical protein FNO01nite_34800 [Flavobacterium noncentrifugens]SDK62646.1 hypothetical protein SAMN04487935_3805 [Flavobacterium noncentrifugens]
MTTKYNQYTIQITSNSAYESDSKYNINDYRNVYFEESEYILPSIFGIKIFENDNLVNSAILGVGGGATTIHQGSLVVSKNRLQICCGNFVFCLSIPELKIIWKTQADEITCFGIYKIDEEFIIHGEMQISKIDKNGNIVWKFGGRDIFVTIDGKDNFSITNNIICVRDFQNYIYKVDLDGNEI